MRHCTACTIRTGTPPHPTTNSAAGSVRRAVGVGGICCCLGGIDDVVLVFCAGGELDCGNWCTGDIQTSGGLVGAKKEMRRSL